MEPTPREAPDRTISELIEHREQAIASRASEHDALRESPEYRAELGTMRTAVRHFAESLRMLDFVATRWSAYKENYLLPVYFDEFVEAALTAQLAIENGALNPARRELRYMVEVAVNIAYVDETRSGGSFDERTTYYRSKEVRKQNADHVRDLPLRMLGAYGPLFADSVVQAWVKASNYVHLTKRRVDEKLKLRQQGVTLGFETLAMLQSVVADLHEACSLVLVLNFETIGPLFTGDVMVALEDRDDWAFHASGWIALIDSYFDKKYERANYLDSLLQKRAGRIRFPLPRSR